jgi:2'-5' RNA ligase
MPYGVVLLADHRTHERLAELAAAIGDADPIHRVGHRAPAHVSVVHFEGDADHARQVAARVARQADGSLPVKIIGLLYAVVPPGDYYVPQGGVYFGVEVVRRPDLNLLHEQALAWVREAGGSPLGAVGADFRPHVTLGVSRGRPALPNMGDVPVEELHLTLAFGELGPYGTFPTLAPR